MSSSEVLVSTSRASDGAWLAVADVAAVASRLALPYRLVGGNAVALLVIHHGVASAVPSRETADADWGMDMQACADARLVPALLATGYHRAAGNRFVRTTASGRRLAIDVVAPSYEARLVPNQPHGDLVLDEVPGLRTALTMDATTVRRDIVLTDGTTVLLHVALPDVRAALVMKAYAYRGRSSAADAVDLWRLLEVARAAGHTGADWPLTLEARDASVVLHQGFRPGGGALRSFTREQATRVRLLVRQVVALSSER